MDMGSITVCLDGLPNLRDLVDNVGVHHSELKRDKNDRQEDGAQQRHVLDRRADEEGDDDEYGAACERTGAVHVLCFVCVRVLRCSKALVQGAAKRARLPR